MHLLRFLFFDGLEVFIWVGVLIYGVNHMATGSKSISSTPEGLFLGLIVPVGVGAYLFWKCIHRMK
jgi:membrane protein DedA with SNARE-associated domain